MVALEPGHNGSLLINGVTVITGAETTLTVLITGELIQPLLLLPITDAVYVPGVAGIPVIGLAVDVKLPLLQV